jgi:hypothetical protein
MRDDLYEDNIIYESNETLEEWLKAFENTDKITLPNIPYNYQEIARELLKRERISDLH